MKKIILLFVITFFAINLYASLQSDSQKKIKELEKLVSQARKKGYDVSRENCALWMAKTFLGYADWDEKNVPANVKQFASWQTYKDNAETMAKDLPDLERSEVVKLLDASLGELKGVLAGKIHRRAVPKIDWTSITPMGNQFYSNGRPVFINDYFTKTQGYDNDYCGSTESVSMSLGNLKEDGTLSYTGNRVKNIDTNFSGYVLLWHGNPPTWAMNKYKGLKKGTRNFTMYDIDNPHIRDMWSNTFSTMIPYTRGKSFTQMGYILSNEPHWFTMEKTWATGSVSDYSMAKFRMWLKSKHHTIDRLNSLWNTNFANFDSVVFALPFAKTLIGTPAGYDWQRFNMNRVTEWFSFLQSEIKKNDPQAKTHIKIIPNHFSEEKHDHGIDFEALTEMNDIIGNDAKIIRKQTYSNRKEYWEGVYAFNWHEVSITYDFFRSVSPDKPNVNSESHFLSASRYRDLYMKPQFVRSAYWLAMLHGMNVSFSWFWAREKDGSIRKDLINYSGPDNAMANAYVASVVQQPRVANEVARTFMDANAFAPEMVAFQNLRKPIRLFYSETSALNDRKYMESISSLYEKQYFDGIPLGFVTSHILDKQDPSAWDIVLVKDAKTITDAEFASLQTYLDKGGIVVIDQRSLGKNEYGEPRTFSLKPSKGTIYKATTDAEFAQIAKSVLTTRNHLPEIDLTETNAINKKGCFWRVIPSKDGHQILTIINLGATTANLSLTKKDNSTPVITNLLEGTQLSPNVILPTEQTLLLEIK